MALSQKGETNTMTDFNNNKLVPTAPKTYTVSELRDTQQFKKESNTPKTYEQFILEEKDLKQEDLYPDLGHEDISEYGSYGPCSTCGVSKKTFKLNMDLRNCAGDHLYGSASNTDEAINESALILQGSGK